MNKKGFTLVELLAVIVILGLVMTIVGTKGFGAFDNTKKAITSQNINAIKEAGRVLATQIENCDDELDDELWTTSDLTVLNSIPAEKKNCSGLKEKMSSTDCIKITVKYLIDNDYLSDNKDFESLKDNDVKICKKDDKTSIEISNTQEENKKIKLADAIINNSKNKTNGTEFLETPKTKVAEEINAPDEKILSTAEDSGGTSYYFRGNVIDNYVDFAGMCWRVVRIAGDGSIKLILEDQDSTCATSDGNWNIPTFTGGTTKTGNFGYTEYAINTLIASDGTQNSNIKYLMNYLNGGTNNSTSMATAFKNFQTGPLANYLSYLSVGKWCYDDRAYENINDNTTTLTNTEIRDKQIKDTKFYYDSYVRLSGKAIKEPTLKCNVKNMISKFVDNTDMYVGTLTADEIVYAGGKVYTSNPDYYLINDYQKSNYLFFWSLSPDYFDGEWRVYSFGVSNHGQVGPYFVYNDYNVYNSFSISFRPAVSLKSTTIIKSGGDGTKANAYKVS